MMSRLRILGVVLLLLPHFLDARPIKKSQATTEKTEFAFPIQQSQIHVEPKDATQRRAPTVGISISSWRPESFSRPTLQGSSPQFTYGKYPFISFDHLSYLTDKLLKQELHLKVGASSANLKRSLTQTQYGNEQNKEQTLTLLSLRIGFELHGKRLLSQSLKPLIGIAVLPTAAFGAQSQLEDRVNEQGLPVEAVAGLLFYPGPLAVTKWGLEKTSLGLVAHGIWGSVGPSRMDGIGAELTLRTEL
jgi:hypothetical protein